MKASSVLDLDKKWFMVPLPLCARSLKDIANSTTSKEEMDAYYQEAQAILDDQRNQNQMDRDRWYSSQFLKRGTIADKIASAAVKLADTDFMFFLDAFDLLFDTARTDAHHYEAALKALAAVWPKLLPPRPLKRFVSQYFATLPTEEGNRKRVLVYWFLEDYLKRTYTQFLSLSEAMLKDRLLQRRAAWLDVVGKLLCSIAESRSVAAAMIIDKLGDNSSQISHSAYHHILKLLSESSMHQTMLLTELEKVVFMKNCPLQTMRYVTNIMNQIVFSKEERKLALRCMQIYLSLFRQLVHTGNVDSRVSMAIIVGLRRAFPYTGTDIAPLEEHLNALYVVANVGNFQERVATLSLLQLLVLQKGSKETFQNRWYRALYRLLLVSPKQFPQSTQLSNFFSMLHKAIRADKNKERVASFVHRLIQRCAYFSDAVVCAVLLLVGEMANTHSYVRELIRGPLSAFHKSQNLLQDNVRYDPKARDPQFSRASSECVWTLHLLTRHPHPSVARLAVLLLLGEELIFDSHPLDDMTTMNFLQMFVDAKGKGDKDEGKADMKAGASVFSRTSHIPNIPSSSDAYFIQASAQDIDVSALFLHRYAVQRQRFLDALSQVRSTWGDASGEVDVALRVTALDSALFGPSGKLAALEDDGDVHGEGNLRKTKNTNLRKHHEDNAKEDDGSRFESEVKKRKGHMSDAIEQDSDAASSDRGLEWGGLDDADVESANEGAADDEGDGTALGGDRHRYDDDGDDFAEVIESHRKEISRKRKREEDWLNARTALSSKRRSR
ncbi:unnamed protein product [Phytomonas sp. EM1]|nr:unnamed protein product [Phytomonas sp. EM1]|eukprot:CCW60942.1 unnamed protein product [Phytomonas sp. isolate EM1]